MSGEGNGPVLGGKVEGKAKQVFGRFSEFDGKTFDDPEEQLDGMTDVAAGRIEETLGKAEGAAIAAAERAGYQEIQQGRADQIQGAVKEAAGKVVEGWGQFTGQPDTELKGIAKQVAGAAQKAVGSASVEQGKAAFNDALDADQSYVTGEN